MMRKECNIMKIVFAASSGGHLEQLLMLKPLMEKYDSILVTEKTDYSPGKFNIKTYYMKQINRKEILFVPKLIINTWRSILLIIKERPNVMITTGVLAVIPLALFIKLFGGKLIYIESFAKVCSKNLTGNFLYKFADQFYVQWEEMLKLYPKAVLGGSIY